MLQVPSLSIPAHIKFKVIIKAKYSFEEGNALKMLKVLGKKGCIHRLLIQSQNKDMNMVLSTENSFEVFYENFWKTSKSTYH
ncbi:hypothetical protein KUTeg_017650 [Tegillarca granosa]|uniref:Uncharacterized protein n=1 Tax=Tegillarca granosa TaxID=220873 RepID=A0ABQ9EJE4_TEGGR|nr:hypothetical protein KUTeg_017650 [Tegillarca granosa]